MKRNIILACIITMIALLLYTDIKSISWLMDYAKIHSDWSSEIMPLVINNLIWLPIIPLYLLWKKKTDFPKWLVILTAVTTTVQLITTFYAEVATDALAAGLPFVLLTIPVSVILLIFSVKQLMSVK